MLYPILKFVRVSALPSAWADTLGGCALALAVSASGVFRFEPAKLPWLLLMTLGIYLGGMAHNDVAHFDKDRLLGKKRPLVTGELPPMAGFIVMLALFATGLLGAFMAGCAGEAAVLVLLVLAYNKLARGRATPDGFVQSGGSAALAVAVIAACRGLHVLLPLLAHAPESVVGHLVTRPLVWGFAATVVVWFMLVTSVSLFEDRGGGADALRWIARLAVPVVFAYPLYLLARPGQPVLVIGLIAPLLVLVALLWRYWQASDRAVADPNPRHVGMLVGAGIRSECLLMAALAWMLVPQQPGWGLAALLCFPAAILAARWVSPT